MIAQVYNIQPTESSDFFYRVKVGAKNFVNNYNTKWINIINFHTDRDKILLNADLAIINFVCDKDIINTIYKRKKLNKPTIFEINDNFLAFQKTNPMYNFYSNPINQNTIIDTINLCDAIQISSPNFIKNLNIKKPYIYLPNNLEKQVIKKSNSIKGKIKIGWGGSSGHYNDIKEISNSIIKLIKENKKFELHIKSDKKIASLFSSLPKSQFFHEPFSSLKEYELFLSKINIGIITISNNDFNLTRTDIKYIEYVKNGVTPLCMNFGPYSFIPNDICEKFTNNIDLIKKIKKLSNPIEITKSYEKNLNYINNNRLEISNTTLRYNFYSKFIDIKPGKGKLELIDKIKGKENFYDYLDNKTDEIDDFNNITLYLKKYSNNLEKIEDASKSFAKNSPSIWLELIKLHYQNNNINKVKKLLNMACIKFPANREFTKILNSL